MLRVVSAWRPGTQRSNRRRGSPKVTHQPLKVVAMNCSANLTNQAWPWGKWGTRVFVMQCCLLVVSPATSEDLLKIDNGTIQVGVDRDKGAAITWLSSQAYPKNIVNVADPGRLIQQSYYAGQRLDRTAEGQSRSWSPWPWNPIQGGGVGSWARAVEFRREGDTLFSETIPKLWDMPNEPAQAVMRQWTAFEPSLANVVVVKCEFISKRTPGDRWGDVRMSPQEVPACYFTRSFATVRSYLGSGQWRAETQPPGPPWGKASPPRQAMACFNKREQGVAVFSPTSTLHWNFGPHARGLSDDPTAGPCMHIAPISRIELAPRSTYRYRYWLVVGNQDEIATSLDALWSKYPDERAELNGRM